MSDRWAALKAWLDAEHDRALTTHTQAAAALHALVNTPGTREWNAAVTAAGEAHGRVLALAEVAGKMRELERSDDN